MSASATCKFPFVEKWKKMGDKNSIIGFIDSVLSSFGQIAFSDNPFCGLLIIIGAFIGSPIQAISGIWAASIATLLVIIMGASKPLIRTGFYTFNAALAGLSIPLFAYSNNWQIPHIFIYSAIGGGLCVIFSAALSELFSEKDLAFLALPYCLTLFILIPASLYLSGIKPQPFLIPNLMSATSFQPLTISFLDFGRAILSGASQIIWQTNIISGIFYFLAVLTSSRIDALSALIGVIIGTTTAILLDLPVDGILIGLYGYNSALIFQALFGRSYKMSVLNFLFTSVLAGISVVLVAALTVIFAPIGAPVLAFPYAIIAISAMLGKKTYTSLKFISPSKWGVPETIADKLKKEN